MGKVVTIKLQNKILEIACYLDKFCRENKIIYYLMGGSALGAIRHKGFIPWDDDLDVFMTYDNYNRFVNACNKNLDKENFYFQEGDTKEWPLFFSKLRMNGTTFIEEDTRNRKMHKGFYVDIMCLNNVSSNTVIRYFQYLSARLVTASALGKRGYITKSAKKRIVINIARVFIKGRGKKFLLNVVRRFNNIETDLVGHFFGRAKFNNTSFPKSYLGKPRYVQFSTTTLPVPEKVENYLKLRYGKDFMKMPSEKTKSEYPSHAAFVDLDNDYSMYEDQSKISYNV